MEYKALRAFNHNGVKYQKNQFVKVTDEDDARVFLKFGFIEKKKRARKPKSKEA